MQDENTTTVAPNHSVPAYEVQMAKSLLSDLSVNKKKLLRLIEDINNPSFDNVNLSFEIEGFKINLVERQGSECNIKSGIKSLGLDNALVQILSYRLLELEERITQAKHALEELIKEGN